MRAFSRGNKQSRLVVRRLTFATLACRLSPFAAIAQTPAAASKAYIPGLEQLMNVILIEHYKLWFAAQARNWPLAAFGEIKEVMGDVQDIVPVFKNLPLEIMLDAVITKEIVDLEKAIDAKDLQIRRRLRQAQRRLQCLPPRHRERICRDPAADLAGLHQSGLPAA
jgi:hypothetical protein